MQFCNESNLLSIIFFLCERNMKFLQQGEKKKDFQQRKNHFFSQFKHPSIE